MKKMSCYRVLFMICVCLLVTALYVQLNILEKLATSQHSVVRSTVHEPIALSFCLHVVHAYGLCNRPVLVGCLLEQSVDDCNYRIMVDRKMPTRMLTELRRCDLFSRMKVYRLDKITQPNAFHSLTLNMTNHYLTDGLYCEKRELQPPKNTNNDRVPSFFVQNHNENLKGPVDWLDLGISNAPEKTFVFMHSKNQLARRLGEHLHVLGEEAFVVAQFSQMRVYADQRSGSCQHYPPLQSQATCIQQCEKNEFSNYHFRFRYMPGEVQPLQFSQLVVHGQCEKQCLPSCVHVHFLLHAFARLPLLKQSLILQARYRRLLLADMLIESRSELETVGCLLLTLQLLGLWLGVGVRCMQRLTRRLSTSHLGAFKRLNSLTSFHRQTSFSSGRRLPISRFQLGGKSWQKTSHRLIATESPNRKNVSTDRRPPNAVCLMPEDSFFEAKCTMSHFSFCPLRVRLMADSAQNIQKFRKTVSKQRQATPDQQRQQHPTPKRLMIKKIALDWFKLSIRRKMECIWWASSVFLLLLGIWHLFSQMLKTELLMDYKLHTQLTKLGMCVCFQLGNVLRPNVVDWFRSPLFPVPSLLNLSLRQNLQVFENLTLGNNL